MQIKRYIWRRFFEFYSSFILRVNRKKLLEYLYFCDKLFNYFN